MRAIIVVAIFTIQRVIPPQRRGELREGRSRQAGCARRYVTFRGFTLALTSRRRSACNAPSPSSVFLFPSRDDGPPRRDADADLCAQEISQLTVRHAIGSMRHLKSRLCRGRNVERERPDARAPPRQLRREPPPPTPVCNPLDLGAPGLINNLGPLSV